MDSNSFSRSSSESNEASVCAAHDEQPARSSSLPHAGTYRRAGRLRTCRSGSSTSSRRSSRRLRLGPQRGKPSLFGRLRSGGCGGSGWASSGRCLLRPGRAGPAHVHVDICVVGAAARLQLCQRAQVHHIIEPHAAVRLQSMQLACREHRSESGTSRVRLCRSSLERTQLGRRQVRQPFLRCHKCALVQVNVLDAALPNPCRAVQPQREQCRAHWGVTQAADRCASSLAARRSWHSARKANSHHWRGASITDRDGRYRWNCASRRCVCSASATSNAACNCSCSAQW